MAKVINFDLSGAEEEVWEQSEGRQSEDPKPGIYKALVRQINPGFSKGADGSPDKKKPRLEVILEVVGDADGDEDALEDRGHDGGNCAGAWLWDYVSFSKASEWKQAQFFKAIGEANPKKAKGKFNAEKHEGKTFAKVRVKQDSYEGSYSPKVGAMWPWDGDGKAADTEDIEAELDDEAGDDEVYTEEELEAMEGKELKAVAKALDVEVKKGKKKATYIKEILAAQEEAEDEDDFDDEEDDDEDLEEGPTADEIREMSPAELKALAKEHGVSLKGMKKSAAIDALIEAVVGDEDEDDDDVPF